MSRQRLSGVFPVKLSLSPSVILSEAKDQPNNSDVPATFTINRVFPKLHHPSTNSE
jgi:hypothetical protein